MAAADLVRDGRWGRLVTLQDGQLGHEALSAVAGRTRQVPPDHPLLHCARQTGVSFGEG